MPPNLIVQKMMIGSIWLAIHG